MAAHECPMAREGNGIPVLRLASVLLVLAYACGLGVGDEREALKRPPWERLPVLLTADWVVRASAMPMRSLTEPKPITGFAFGPGRNEIAFCAAPDQGPSTLWVLPLRSAEEFRKSEEGGPEPDSSSPATTSWEDSQPKARLLWTSPPGVGLRGPIWWAPNGSHVALRAQGEDGLDLVVAGYATGEATWVTRGANITDAAWSYDARWLACVDVSSGRPVVSVQSIPVLQTPGDLPEETRKLGEGGERLRWTVDSKALSWLRSDGSKRCVEMTWQVGSDRPKETGQTLPRPEEGVWSPDALLYALLEGDGGNRPKLPVIYPAASPAGDAVGLPAMVHPERLLGWSPDNRLVLFTADMSIPFAVSAAKATNIRDDILAALEELDGLTHRDVRYSFLGLPMDPEAGAPSWSSDGRMLAYVVAKDVPDGPDYFGLLARPTPPGASAAQLEQLRKRAAERRAHLLSQWPPGALVVVPVDRLPLPPPQEVAEAVAEAEGQMRTGLSQDQWRELQEHGLENDPVAVKLMRNAGNISIAVQMSLADQGRFPGGGSFEEMQKQLQGYFKQGDYNPWVDPEGSGRTVARWVLPEGATPESIGDWAMVPVVVVDSLSQWDIVAFADGHTEILDKGQWQSLVEEYSSRPQ